MPGSISLYEISIPVFLKQLGILSKLLQKGVAHAADSSNEVKESTLTEAKLVADMGDLCYQSEFIPCTSRLEGLKRGYSSRGFGVVRLE